jgi:hypothetical protein
MHNLAGLEQTGWGKVRSATQFELAAMSSGGELRKIVLAGITAAGFLSGTALLSDLPGKAPVFNAPTAPPPYIGQAPMFP